jgi:Cft2 family RNA processing exonuclease
VPFWLYSAEAARAIIEENVAPGRVIVIQKPSRGRTQEVFDLSQDRPDVVFLTTAMATVEF